MRERNERKFSSIAAGGLQAGRDLKALYRGLGPSEAGRKPPGNLEYFLTERYCPSRPKWSGQIIPPTFTTLLALEEAEGGDRAKRPGRGARHTTARQKPVLHLFAPIAVYVWPAEAGADGAGLAPVTATATPLGIANFIDPATNILVRCAPIHSWRYLRDGWENNVTLFLAIQAERLSPFYLGEKGAESLAQGSEKICRSAEDCLTGAAQGIGRAVSLELARPEPRWPWRTSTKEKLALGGQRD